MVDRVGVIWEEFDVLSLLAYGNATQQDIVQANREKGDLHEWEKKFELAALKEMVIIAGFRNNKLSQLYDEMVHDSVIVFKSQLFKKYWGNNRKKYGLRLFI